MPIFNTPRAGRNQKGYMETLIEKMCVDERVLDKQGYGVVDVSPGVITATFDNVRNGFGKDNKVKVHYLEIYVELEFGIDKAMEISRFIGDYFYDQGFLAFINTMVLNNYYLIAVAINAVSYKTGQCFADNNAQYANLYKVLKRVFPADWKLDVENCVFFNPKDGKGNYIHGKLV